jgi:integrase
MSIERNERLESVFMMKYLENVEQMNRSTAAEYKKRLASFSDFVFRKYGYPLDHLIEGLARDDKSLNVYEILSSYVAFLNSYSTLSPQTINYRLITATNLLEFNDVSISPRIFKHKVRRPKAIKRVKEALEKKTIVEILNACSDIRLKTYVMLLASTGMRPSEALSTSISDYDFESNPSKLHLRGEYTKTKTDRIIFLTQETVRQLHNWLQFKYRERRVSYYDKDSRNSISERRTPAKSNNDLIFSVRNYRIHRKTSCTSMYSEMAWAFSKSLDRMGLGEREKTNRSVNKGVRRKITLHSFRRFVKSTISDLGHYDFSEYFIGHSGSTYYRKTENEKIEIFKKIEPYLTFLDVSSLDRRYGDTQSRIEELEEINQSLRQRDRIKDDAIGQISDQLMALTTRLQEVERKQREY